jgi:hypothetical protein
MSDEIRASASAHQDLGPGYDTAIAEGLVERIGDEIDQRVDARLRAHLSPPPAVGPAVGPAPAAARPARGPGLGVGAVVLALGSMALGIGATAAVLHPGLPNATGGMGALVALVWIVIGVINVTYARHR